MGRAALNRFQKLTCCQTGGGGGGGSVPSHRLRPSSRPGVNFLLCLFVISAAECTLIIKVNDSENTEGFPCWSLICQQLKSCRIIDKQTLADQSNYKGFIKNIIISAFWLITGSPY